MLKHILQQIQSKAKAEIDQIKKNKQKTLDDLEKELNIQLKNKRLAEEKQIKKKIKQEIDQAKQKFALDYQEKVNSAQKEVFKQVYKRALARLAKLDQAEFKQLIKRLLSSLPNDGLSGKFFADKKTAYVLQELLPQAKIDQNLNDLGFIYKSDKVELDCCFKQIILQNKELIEPQLIKQLSL